MEHRVRQPRVGQFRRLPLGIALTVCALAIAVTGVLGCDITKIAADQTAVVFTRATPGLEQYFDYTLAADAMPALIVTLESILRVTPDDDDLMAEVVKGYVGYGFGVRMLESDRLRFEGKLDESQKVLENARGLFLRGLDLSKNRLRSREDGLDEALRKTPAEFTAWLTRFDDKADADPLLFAGFCWGLVVMTSLTDMEAIANFPYAKAMVERSVALNPAFYYSAGEMFLGMAEALSPSSNMVAVKSYFERAIEREDRRALLNQVAMAGSYATKAGDRPLFDKLLAEVLAAKDPLPEARLLNLIAIERAKLYQEFAADMF